MTPHQPEPTQPRPQQPHPSLLNRVPLRLRITFWVLAIFAVVHVTLSLVVVLYFRQYLLEEIDTALRQASAVYNKDQAWLLSEDEILDRIAQHEQAARWGPLAVILYDEVNGPTDTAGPYDDVRFKALLDHALDAEEHGKGRNEAVRSEGFYLITRPLPENRLLVVAAPAASFARALDTVALVLLLTLPVGLVSSGASTWFLSEIAVRPIRQIRRFADQLSAETIPKEIILEDASPEVEALRLALQSAMGRIEAGYDQQARFLANVSHELKTPISVVRTEAEVLLSGDAPQEDLRDFAASTAEEMQRLGRMIESFLLLTRVRQGKSRVQPKRLDANEILMESFEHCLTMASQYNVALAPMLHDADPPATVEGNADLLRTAIDNLVRNAIRFSPQGERVEITCAVVGKRVRITVRDYGPGIPPELLKRVFEPFTQAANERRRGRGTGLGLQIAQGIAELHGGRIRAENLDQGCAFRISLPRATAREKPGSKDETKFTQPSA